MDKPTENLSRYVKEKRINLSKMARETGIPYLALYDSLRHRTRARNMSVGEFMTVCRYLRIDPVSMAEEG